jgi:hypothetical protein
MIVALGPKIIVLSVASCCYSDSWSLWAILVQYSDKSIKKAHLRLLEKLLIECTVLNGSLWRARGIFCSWKILHGCPRINTVHWNFRSKIFEVLFLTEFFFVTKKPNLDPVSLEKKPGSGSADSVIWIRTQVTVINKYRYCWHTVPFYETVPLQLIPFYMIIHSHSTYL